MYKNLKLTTIFLLLPFLVWAQEKTTVHGNVTEGGIGLPGVNVRVKNTKKGAITDLKGAYKLDGVDENAVLVFSYVGYLTQEIPRAGKSVLNVALVADAKTLGEVVVTALGMERENKKIGYAMSEIKGEKVAGLHTVNPASALQGQSAGVSVGGSDGGLFGGTKIQIRGISSLNSNNNQPIFVIDGVILENAVSNKSADWNSDSDDFGNILKNLNPDDYKSISILKGAAATALYGSRGINGVVLIATKSGSRSKGLGITVKQSVGLERVYALPDIQYAYGPGIMAGYVSYGEKDAKGKYRRFSTEQFYKNNRGMPTYVAHPRHFWGWGPRFDGRAIEGYDGKTTTYSPVKDHLKKAYDKGWSSNTSVALSGGTEKGHFYLSNSYSYRTGIFPGNRFKRNALLFKGTYDLSAWLRAEASVAFTTSTAKNPANNLSENFIYARFPSWYDTEKYKQRTYWQASHGGIPDNKYGDKYGNVPGRSVWFDFKMNEKTMQEQVVRPIVRLTADLTPALSVNAEANINAYTTQYEDKKWGRGYANEGGYYQISHTNDLSKTFKLSVDYAKTIAPDLIAHLILGGKVWQQKKSLSKSETDGGLIVPGKFYIANSKKNAKTEGKIFGTKQINSLYFFSNLSYKDQLFLDITGRNDWSSSLVYTNGNGNYAYFYPSVSLSWLFNQTFALPNWVNFGKLRASWAQVGSDTDPYSINKGYKIEKYEMNNGRFVYKNGVSTTLVNQNIHPERKNSLEVGMELQLLNRRLGLDLAYYDEKISQQIGEIPLPEESGYKSFLTNIGTLRNYGLELTLRGTPLKKPHFEWETVFNYWRNRTKVLELHPDYGEYKLLGGAITYGNFRVGSAVFEGGEYGILLSDSAPKKFQATNENGAPIDHPYNGMKILNYNSTTRSAYYIRSGKVEKIGKIQPDFEGSWHNNFSYKGFKLGISLDARFGGHIASFSSKYGTSWGRLATSLPGRDATQGGISWTSQYSDSKGQTFNDGILPEGVFAKNTIVTTPDGKKQNLSNMTFKEAYEKGYIEPSHASYFHYRINSWGAGVVNDNWFAEVKYIALRNISLGYNLPKNLANKIGAQSLYVALNARNLGYLYNSLPNRINPESFRGNSSNESFRERNFMPYSTTYTMSLTLSF